MRSADRRRRLLAGAALGAVAVPLAAQGPPKGPAKGPAKGPPDGPVNGARAADAATTATEALMLEHGVLRRCLGIYREAALRLRFGGGDVPVSALRDAVALFREFGERHHEGRLEEDLVFPQYARLDDAARATATVLVDQHQRGREINGWVHAMTATRLSATDALEVADALDGFVRMYVHHAALEDTIVFPRWKASLDADALRETARRFERIEARELGRDGREDALARIAGIEGAFLLGQLARWTAPPPPVRRR